MHGHVHRHTHMNVRPLDLQFALRSQRRMTRIVGTCPACKMVWLLVRHCAYRVAWEQCVQERHCNLPCVSAADFHCLLVDLARRVSGLHRDEQTNLVIKVVKQYLRRRKQEQGQQQQGGSSSSRGAGRPREPAGEPVVASSSSRWRRSRLDDKLVTIWVLRRSSAAMT